MKRETNPPPKPPRPLLPHEVCAWVLWGMVPHVAEVQLLPPKTPEKEPSP